MASCPAAFLSVASKHTVQSRRASSWRCSCCCGCCRSCAGPAVPSSRAGGASTCASGASAAAARPAPRRKSCAPFGTKTPEKFHPGRGACPKSAAGASPKMALKPGADRASIWGGVSASAGTGADSPEQRSGVPGSAGAPAWPGGPGWLASPTLCPRSPHRASRGDLVGLRCCPRSRCSPLSPAPPSSSS